MATAIGVVVIPQGDAEMPAFLWIMLCIATLVAVVILIAISTDMISEIIERARWQRKQRQEGKDP